MRIGLNALYLLPGEVGGTEAYAAGLIRGLAEAVNGHEILVFVNQEAKSWDVPEREGFSKVACPVSATNRMRRYQYEQFHFPKLLKQYSIDLVHSLGYVAPLRAPCPSVVTIHDLNYRACGKQMPLARRLALAVFVRNSAKRCQRVIAVSEFARQEILREFRLPGDRVTAIHEAPLAGERLAVVHAQQELDRLRIRRPYVAAFASKFPHKNIPRLIEAFGQAQRAAGLAHQLVLIGHRPNDGSCEAAVRSTGLADRVVFTGFVAEPVMQAVLSQAQMLAFPSLYEGFGLPVLEAMAAGVPVVCSTAGSLPEVAGEAALFFDPLSVEHMASAILQVAGSESLRCSLIAKGYRNLCRFSWKQTAEQTLQVYHEARGTSTPDLAASMRACYVRPASLVAPPVDEAAPVP